MRFNVLFVRLRIFAALLGVLACSQLQAACPDAEATIANACPELYAELDRVGLVDALDLASTTAASAQTVRQLEQYLALARQPELKQASLDEKMLDQVISDNYRAAKRKELSFMERLSAWWDSLWGSKERVGPNVDFWKKFIPTETFARALFYLLSGLLSALLLVYGWRELQPFLAARRSAVAKSKAKPQKSAETWPPKIAQLPSNLALAKAYAALVRLLTERQKLPDVPGLTHAELAQAFAERGSVNPAPANLAASQQAPYQASQQASAAAENSQRFSGISAHAARALFTEQVVSAEELGSFLSLATALVQASADTASAIKSAAAVNVSPAKGSGDA